MHFMTFYGLVAPRLDFLSFSDTRIDKSKRHYAEVQATFRNRSMACGRWDKLPAAVLEYGTKPDEILVGWEDVKKKVGKKQMKKIPLGAVAMWNYADKLACGLQQFMAGARKLNLSELERSDLLI
ncbi:MAG: hypothetical protein HN580_14675 [Deltaproteobacteria bacterium]|nr:hypothetical protein [Deltaproteobacteria bacterium]MBT4263583.1 hypothetical protein [Deltaproteobacteria bacterium]MBT6614789.1 hypothetical protein [Deltaproteobacteria bacterium]MBT7152541.1 hypothetical protein [Deltaproteobacteria bacterium]MBT7890264.1 hypothetical protein [Deltaproteobacteria bacterium]